MQYAYDEMSRVTRITPAQGTNYRTDYAFNKNGSLDTATTYDNGTGAETSYTYNTTSGKLAQRNLPESGRQNIRTTYSYDSAGRLEYETVTREAAGTTNLYRTGYAYSYASYHRQVVRTEQNYDSGWVDDIVGQPSLAVILCQGQQITGRDARATGMERNNGSQARMPAPPEARGLRSDDELDAGVSERAGVRQMRQPDAPPLSGVKRFTHLPVPRPSHLPAPRHYICPQRGHRIDLVAVLLLVPT